MLRAKFAASCEDGIIFVHDMGGKMSVTNDAESVVEFLGTQFDLANCRIIYSDSEGRYDGIAVKGGQFAGFVLLGCSTENEAIHMAKNRPHWHAGHGVLDHG